MAENQTILVTGATGNQGRAVCFNLLASGKSVRGMTRDPGKARIILGSGIELLQGDFRNPLSLRKALSGVDGAFVMGTPHEEGSEAEIEQGKAMIDACADQGVGHVVYSSACGANRSTGVPHFDSKHHIERHLKKTGLPCTILRPVWFMENFASSWYLPSIEKEVLSTPLRSDRPLQMVSVSDVGRFAAAAFLQPSAFIGQEIDIAGDELTMEQIVREISRALSRLVRYEQIPEEKADQALGRSWALMFKWFNKHGYDIDIGALRERFDIPLTPFRRFLEGTRLARRNAA
jgi:uncharacterized protein YbjT (DUF2867 family)